MERNTDSKNNITVEHNTIDQQHMHDAQQHMHDVEQHMHDADGYDKSDGTVMVRQHSRWHYFTYWIVCINVIVFFWMSMTGSTNDIVHLVEYGAKVNAFIADGEFYRLITPLFLHGGIAHIAFNSMALLQMGVETERTFGKWRFLLIYFGSGLIASLGSFLFNDSISVGASGAIFGLFGANLFLFTLDKELYKQLYRLDTLGLIAANIAFGFMVPSIDNFGHIFGLLGGFLICWACIKTHYNEDRKSFRYLAAITLITFVVAAPTLGIPKERESDNYLYTHSLLSFLNGRNEEGLAYLKDGLDRFPSSVKLTDLLNRLIEAGVVQQE